MAEVSEGQWYKLEKNPTRKNGEWDTRKHRECADLKVGHYTWRDQARMSKYWHMWRNFS